MKRLLFAAVVLSAVLLVRNHMAMKPAGMEKYIQQLSLKAAQDPKEACGMIDDKIEVSIRQETPAATWEVEGGKDELCGFMDQIRASRVVLQSNVTWRYENVNVKSSFPWHKARVSYDEISSISAARIGTIHSTVHYELEVKRPLFGSMVITKLQATGGTEQ